MHTAQQLIQQYALQLHPEGGWYKETYKSNERIRHDALPARFSGDRVFSTAIYFLLTAGSFSAFHRIKADECWHFYAGDVLQIFILQADGTLAIINLGNYIDNGQLYQYVVPANCWFASRPAMGSTFSFVGCTVAPGFEFADFELADAAMLTALYPKHRTIIKALCR